ncbi:MAG: DUF1707 and DUF2154 domain-containing protein [Gemmatimonadetes bacterium]|nr:MAG: DUF1707 and DUF2154 domain-containing protein [Gemmatimonadota bacterium]
MTEGPGPGPAIRAERERTIDALMEHFANDTLEMEEFERRLDLAHRAGSEEDLRRLLADLPALSSESPVQVGGGAVPARRAERRPADPSMVREDGWVVAVLGGYERTGRWVPARKLNVVGVLGGAELDFRDALLAPGITEVRIFAFCGGVEIIVPPDLPVEVDGFALMGGFSNSADAPTSLDPDQPVLRVRGVACMGGAEVHVRLPGETGGDARRRRRRERKERRKRLRRGEP